MSNLTALQANESRQLVAAAARGHTTSSCDAHAPINSPRKSSKADGKDTLRRDVSPLMICRVVMMHVSGRQTVTETAAENLGYNDITCIRAIMILAMGKNSFLISTTASTKSCIIVNFEYQTVTSATIAPCPC